MKKLILEDIHKNLGAKMLDYASYKMPIRYSSDIEEHLAVRNDLGLFDVSHMGEFVLEGEDALELIQLVTTNDASKLNINDVQYSCMLNENGGIVDDLLVYRLDEYEYMLVVNASNIEKDWNHIKQYHDRFDYVKMLNLSDSYCLFALQGEKSLDILNTYCFTDISNLEYYKSCYVKFYDHSLNSYNFLISRTGYTGEKGVEIYVENEYAKPMWDFLMRIGKYHNIKPIGLGARDTLRLEKGFCLYGNDINENTSPYEANLSWIVNLDKYFIGKDKLDKNVNKFLTGFIVEDKGIARQNYEIYDSKENKIGYVTSGTISPCLDKAIGLAYIDSEYKEDSFFIKNRNKFLKAKRNKYPFI